MNGKKKIYQCSCEKCLEDPSDPDVQEHERINLMMNTLNERDRRLFAGYLSISMGHGGDSVLAGITGKSPKTIQRGREELEQKKISEGVRWPGAGRPVKVIDQQFLDEIQKTIEDETAGDPMTGKKWLRKTLRWIKRQLSLKGIHASISTIWKALKKLGYSLKCNVKNKSTKEHPQRDEQFNHLNQAKKDFLDAGKPVISIDCKKKELIGNFKNPGRTWRKEPLATLDHDFPSDAEGKLVPFGIYDLARNSGYLYCGISRETSEFVVDALTSWWETIGQYEYPGSTEILILCDSGGGNGYRLRLWKWELQTRLADGLGLTVTVCHYPSGASKWNPIEHRLFSFISLNWAGEPLVSYEAALGFIKSTKTEQGLVVDAILLDKIYQKGIKISDEEIACLNLERHVTCPQWNYTIKPRENAVRI